MPAGNKTFSATLSTTLHFPVSTNSKRALQCVCSDTFTAVWLNTWTALRLWCHGGKGLNLRHTRVHWADDVGCRRGEAATLIMNRPAGVLRPDVACTLDLARQPHGVHDVAICSRRLTQHSFLMVERLPVMVPMQQHDQTADDLIFKHSMPLHRTCHGKVRGAVAGLVAQGPQDDAGVVAVASHHASTAI